MPDAVDADRSGLRRIGPYSRTQAKDLRIVIRVRACPVTRVAVSDVTPLRNHPDSALGYYRGTVRIRERSPADSAACLDLARWVHEADDYPRYAPQGLPRFLMPACETKAW